MLRAHGRVLLGTVAQASVRDLLALGIAAIAAGKLTEMHAEERLAAVRLAMVIAVALQIGYVWRAGVV